MVSTSNAATTGASNSSKSDVVSYVFLDEAGFSVKAATADLEVPSRRTTYSFASARDPNFVLDVETTSPMFVRSTFDVPEGVQAADGTVMTAVHHLAHVYVGDGNDDARTRVLAKTGWRRDETGAVSVSVVFDQRGDSAVDKILRSEVLASVRDPGNLLRFGLSLDSNTTAYAIKANTSQDANGLSIVVADHDAMSSHLGDMEVWLREGGADLADVKTALEEWNGSRQPKHLLVEHDRLTGAFANSDERLAKIEQRKKELADPK